MPSHHPPSRQSNRCNPWLGILVAIALWAVPIPGQAQAPQVGGPSPGKVAAQWDALKTAALDAYNAKQYAQAAEKLQAYATHRPDDAQAQRVLGAALTELGRFDAAIAAKQRAAQLAPADSRNWNGLCWTLILANRSPEGRPACEKAVALDETDWAARVNLGHTWLLAGDATAAQTHYRDVLWRVNDETDLREGPLAHFALFIAKGWHVTASQSARAWFLTEWPRWQTAQQLTREDIRLFNAGRLSEALTTSEQAAQLSASILGPEHPQTGVRLNNLAGLYKSMGRYEQALPLYQRALAIAEKAQGPEHPSTGNRLNNLAWLYASMGRYEQALPLYQRALAIAEKAAAPELAWTLQGNLMQLFGLHRAAAPKLHQPNLAIWYGKQSINTLQSVRGNMKALDKDLQQSFLKKNEKTYNTLTDLLIEAGRIAEAEQVLAMLKQSELSELVRSTAGPRTQADFVGVERVALDEQRRLTAAGVKDAAELAVLEKRGADLNPPEQARLQELRNAALERRAEYQRFLSGLGQLFARAGSRGGEQQAKTEATRLQTKVALDTAGAVGLHYVMTDTRISIIVATPRESFGRFSPVSRIELNKQIGALRAAIRAKADTRPAAQALWQALIAPVQADIQAAGAKTLVLSLTDTLRYLPFAALQDESGRYLVQDYALSLWAAAADVSPAASKTAWQVAGLGLTQARPGFDALGAVRAELQGIVRTANSPAGLLPGSIALDEQFGRAQFDAALQGQNNVVHVASHFDFRPGDESRSVLLLGKGDETLSIGQLAVMNFSQVDLLTLSACDTAVGGGINENGAEVEGLAAAVLDAKAQAVLATLWKVADDSTASLMRAFYAQRVQGKQAVSRAQALRQAQLALLQGATGGAPAAPAAATAARAARQVGPDGKAMTESPVDPARPWAHPYFWAPFVLSGNWL